MFSPEVPRDAPIARRETGAANERARPIGAIRVSVFARDRVQPEVARLSSASGADVSRFRPCRWPNGVKALALIDNARRRNAVAFLAQRHGCRRFARPRHHLPLRPAAQQTTRRRTRGAVGATGSATSTCKHGVGNVVVPNHEVPLLMDDDTIAFGEEEEAAQNAGKLKHPYVTLFHLAFRIAAIIVYLLCGLFSNSFIASFVTVVLLLSMDFWTVKNITGRLMVGLRWWNYVDDDGKSHWIFESRKNRINATEARIFWLALILCPLFWSMLFIAALFSFKFKWLLLVCIAIVLNGANLYGYVKCKMGNDQNISAATSDFFRKQVFQNVTSIMTRSPPTNNSNQPTNVI
ncbi:PREDICTED: uncharacterized Golgi apparatus membrane protein-like protein CG5021 isoform X2 [Vollenhovia emeryi]|uniref:uncharacterized Golgi apparatus membrane protein-like protein CG5021 isoform X2 n=1 Tax=Vollenhovia emeryi TaxID=411798 RepID=UPI0005F5531E|nr:PREDICTED: uncharacterized Golgi apparatus membrane protein-like protein CG5021 isoform X2 [Vollenhovia emeryi]